MRYKEKLKQHLTSKETAIPASCGESFVPEHEPRFRVESSLEMSVPHESASVENHVLDGKEEENVRPNDETICDANSVHTNSPDRKTTGNDLHSENDKDNGRMRQRTFEGETTGRTTENDDESIGESEPQEGS